MLTQLFAQHFAHEWIAAWNAKDLDRILAHYTDDFTMSSPFIVTIAGEPSGTLKGKQAVGAYWAKSLAKYPDRRFILLGVHAGTSSVVLRYRTIFDIIGCETFFFTDEGKVHTAAAHYNSLDIAGAAASQTPLFVKHVTPILNVSDIRASIAWFEKFGWRKCWDWGHPPSFGSVGSGECEIFMCLNGQGSRGKGPNVSTGGGPGQDDTIDKGVWMSLWVDDVDAIHARCVAEGLEVTHPPTNEPWGVREFHLRHPDGHVFRISKGLSGG